MRQARVVTVTRMRATLRPRAWFLVLDHYLELYELFAAVNEVKKEHIVIKSSEGGGAQKKHNLRHGLLTSAPVPGKF